MHTHSLKIEKDKPTLLLRNGHPLECPFKTSAAGQDNLGRISFVGQACSSNCSHFHVHDPGNPAIETRVELTCGKGAEFKIQKDVKKEDDKDSKIISL